MFQTGKSGLKGYEDKNDDIEQRDDRYDLSVHDIDAFWLQRQLSRFYNDANTSARLAEDTLTILQNSDERVCENQLVVLLDFDKFDFIKILLKNRRKIYYCTRLKQAQNDESRILIESEMLSESTGEGAKILQLVNQKASAETWTHDRIGEFANKARQEARSLTKGHVDAAATISAGDEEIVISSTGNVMSALVDKSNNTSVNKLVDLEGLTFREGAHLMVNQRCELPEKSWRAQKKGYEEVHVPAVRAVVPPGEHLVDVVDLPEWTQAAFGSIRSLNRIQSKMVDAALYQSENVLLCAPTGGGKTNVALMCMLNALGNYRRSDGSFELDKFKIVYIAPMKALVQEVVLSFGKRLQPYGITVMELSGDQTLTRDQIQRTQVIVTTPEKWVCVHLHLSYHFTHLHLTKTNIFHFRIS